MREERGGGGRGRDKDKKDGKAGEAPRRGFFRRRRVCKFCAEKIDYINYKDVRLLMPFLPERGKIQPRRISGTCALHPRKLALAVTEGNKRQIERERKVADVREAEEKQQAEALGQRLEAIEIQIARRVGDYNTLYGSVTSAD